MGRMSIYPSEARENNFSQIYAEIAIKNYVEAKKLRDIIVRNNYDIDNLNIKTQMEQCIIIVCIFSAMAIESFLNDYAAACMGDSDFYDNFDKLSVISKLQLVAKFILKKDINRSLSYYANLKALIKQRDSFVHNKSKKAEFQGYTLERMQEIAELKRRHNVIETELTLSKKEITEDFLIAQTSIKAIRDFAYFFDEADSNSRALVRFFSIYNPKEVRKTHYNEVINDFNIGGLL